MYCSECGTTNTADSKFCRECGTKFDEGFRSVMLSVQDRRDLDDPETQDRLAKMLDMAFWHNQAGNLEAAVLACESALVINPNSTTAHSLIATIFEKQGRDQEAIAEFEAVLAINPDSAADAAKLDNLRRGVRVRAVAPPAHHRWLPPALASLSVAKMQQRWESASWRGRPLPKNTLAGVAAGIAVLLILGIGYAVARANSTKTSTTTQIAYVPRATSSSAFGGGLTRQSSVPTIPPAIVMTPSPGGAVIPFHFVGRDPFADNEKYTPPPAPSLPRGRIGDTAGGGSASSLPPLTNLQAVPSAPGGIAPAPVNVTNVPQHTVVVSQLGGNGGQDTSGPSAPAAGPPPVPSRIRIVVNHDSISRNSPDDGASDSNDSNSAPVESPSAPPPASGPSDSGGDSAESDQQEALTQQQQGNLKRARTLYAQAIRGYKAQIASGRNVEAAQRGLQACQTGLQICQQGR